jgi:chorismate lyase / 3-hydroxybenzoate synthase
MTDVRLAPTAPRCSFGQSGESGGGRPLGIVSFGAGEGIESRDGTVRLAVPSTPAGGPFDEVWTTGGTPVAVTGDLIHYAHDGEYAFFAAHLPPADRWADQVEALYAELFTLLAETSYRNLVRGWNYLGRINEPNADGEEIYRDFCLGRARAFARHGAVDRMPAATGVGANGEGVAVCLLAARTAEPVHIENPHQVPAYRYPPRYGPRSPSFARATWTDPALFVSGTASIVGHESVHPGEVTRQIETSLGNIATVISGANVARYGISRGFTLADLTHVKAYVRHRRDLPLVQRYCQEAFGHDVRYLIADICRAELLVEIEGVIG